MNSTFSHQRWDIFCKVIDNYGDIGVCWRLARQLATEYPFTVRLWVDDLRPLTKIAPSASTVSNCQMIEGIEVVQWQEPFGEAEPADVVIEAFACHLPEAYIRAMKRQASPPYWFNLEYLSAEQWVEEYHSLVSIHPQTGLKKMFFFPGFTAKTGGLLREKTLFERRDTFLQSNLQTRLFLDKLGIKEVDDHFLISLFSYENRAIGSLLEAWAQSRQPVLCLVPAGKILPGISGHIGLQLNIGDEYRQGSLTLKVIPFLSQAEYDQLLWVCDMNFIRGEDSFVRAQWAAKPFVWHIYPQDEDYHLVKLDAFLEMYTETLVARQKADLIQLWHQWNTGASCMGDWNSCMENYPQWLDHSQNWCHTLESQDDLAANLVHFCQKTL